MRNLFAAAIAAGLLSLGAIGAADAANPNVPTWSPYAIGDYDAATYHRGHAAPRSTLTEGRAADVSPGGIYGRPGNDFGPGYDYPSPASPYKWAASPLDFH
jgi:hypothetical protein